MKRRMRGRAGGNGSTVTVTVTCHSCFPRPPLVTRGRRFTTEFVLISSALLSAAAEGREARR
jgi:hypothetical protein